MASKRRRKRTKGPGLVATLRDPDKIRIAYLIAGLALVFGGSLGFGATQCGSPSTQRSPAQSDPSDPIATIGDRVITYMEFARDYEQQARYAEMQDDSVLRPPEFESNLKYRVLRQMIDMEYFDIRASEQGITITDEEVEAQLDQWRSSIMPQAVEQQDRSLLQRIQDALGTVKEEKEFEQALRQRDPTLTISRLRDIIRQELMAQHYVSQLSTEKELEIREELVERGNEIRDEIIAGRDFADAVMEYSDHEDSASAGGLIPMVTRNSTDVPQAVIQTTFGLPIGEISLPVPTNEEGFRGVWLIEVISSKLAEGEEWEAAREGIRQQLLEVKREQYEAGELLLEDEESITVDEQEVIDAYEEATIRVIYLEAEDPMGRVTEAVHEDEKTLDIVIYDPEIRAMHHIIEDRWDLAAADYHEALQDNASRLAEDESNLLVIEMQEANLRYLIGNLWTTRAFTLEAEWFQGIWQDFQNNPDAFGGEFPQTPPSIKREQQGYFVLGLKNINRAIELEGLDPFYRLQRASIDVSREQLMPRLIEDLQVAHEYSSRDYNIETRTLDIIRQAIGLDDRVLEEAGGVRPETHPEVILPEDEAGITLPQLDAPFIELIEIAAAGTMGTPDEDASEVTDLPVEDPSMDSSVAESDLDIPDDTDDEPGEFQVLGATETIELPAYVPDVPIPEPSGPLTLELRTELEELLTLVQNQVDILQAEKEALEAAEQARMQEQATQFQLPSPEEPADTPPSDEAENLLTEGEEVDE